MRSRFAWQVSDLVNGRRDVLSKPPPDPASSCLPASGRWWADGARCSLGRQRRWCLPFLGHLLNGNLHGNWRLDRSCRKKSRSSCRRPRGRRMCWKHLSGSRPGRPGWRRRWAPVTRRARHRWFSHQLWTPPGLPWKLLAGLEAAQKTGPPPAV